MRKGYGVVDKTSKALALKVLLGKEELPARPDVDAWLAGVDALRNAVWGQP